MQCYIVSCGSGTYQALPASWALGRLRHVLFTSDVQLWPDVWCPSTMLPDYCMLLHLEHVKKNTAEDLPDRIHRIRSTYY
ncbi:hypothetical protein NDU88_005714 [Pleurodeles waltl]|uniref:Uncharacterized protein n=1 Tax=Pleurodeles waltl TaxID=8319 RepID=A0AAV7SMH1_PLEWA|nr:hypothetical protein NDU88_005714 [Pleurodeles waltl]